MHKADREILNVFITCRDATIELARRIPDDLLALPFTGDRLLTVAETLVHTADGANWWMNHCMGDGKGRTAPTDSTERDMVVNWLIGSRDRLVTFFEADDGANMGRVFQIDHAKGDGSWTGRNRVLYLTAHEIHHRAKAVLMLRQAGFDDFPFFPF